MPSINSEQRGSLGTNRKGSQSGDVAVPDMASYRSVEDILNPDELDDNDLETALENLRKNMHLLRLENEMMIRYLVRNAEFDESNLREQLDRLGDRLLGLEMGRRRTRSLLPNIDVAVTMAGSSSFSQRGRGASNAGSIVSFDENTTLPKEFQQKIMEKKSADETGEQTGQEDNTSKEGVKAGKSKEDEQGSPSGETTASGQVAPKEGGEPATKGKDERVEKEGDQPSEGNGETASAEAVSMASATSVEGAPEGSAKKQPVRNTRSPSIISPSRSAASAHTSNVSLYTTSSGILNFEKRGPRLNLPGKSEMLSRELHDGRKDMEEFEAECARRKLKLGEVLEAANTTADELHYEVEMFEREVTVGGIDPVTGRIPAERFIRHVTEFIRTKQMLSDKLRLRSSTLRVNIRKVKIQLKAKKELGESLTPVDFEQLRIDNERFLSTIEQKNLQVIELKRMAGDCALQLSVHKKALLSDRSIEDFLRSLGDERRRQCAVMEVESEAVEEQTERLENRLESLRALTENFTAPPVLEYARLCSKITEQEHERRVWKRRVNLQETALRVAASNLRSSRKRQRSLPNSNIRQLTQDSNQVDDVNDEAFQKFWFGGIDEEQGKGKVVGKDAADQEADTANGDKSSISLEEDSWTDIPDSFFTEDGLPIVASPRRPCTPPRPQSPQGQQTLMGKRHNKKK